MDYTSVIRLMLLTKALKYQKLCEISIIKAQEALDSYSCATDIDEYRKLCSETEKAKLYDEFSNELKELADRIMVGEGSEEETGDS